ncbi:MAG: TadE family protein [Planctomycetota bacterium]
MSATAKRLPKDGQEATATVELAILLPVYMLIFVGVMTIGHLVLIRQKVVEAVRFQAWAPNYARTQNNTQITDNFFATYQPFSAGGGYTSTKQKQPYKLNDSRFAQCFDAFPGATAQQKEFAKKVLNDEPQLNAQTADHLSIVTVEGRFSYQPDWMQAFLRTALVEPRSGCTVLHRTFNEGQRPAERKSMIVRPQGSGSQLNPWEIGNRNPIEDYAVSANRFEISTETENTILQNGAHNRFYTPGAKDNTVDETNFVYQYQNGIPTEGNPEPGLWNPSYRLGGTAQQPDNVGAERAIFHRMLYGN